MRTREGRWRSVALVLAGVVAGQMLIGPAGAHITTFKHLKARHFFTKLQSDLRYFTKGQADARFKTRWAFLELDATPRILKQTGGFTMADGGTGEGVVNVGEDATNKAIVVSPEFGALQASAGVCGGETELTIFCVPPENDVNHVSVTLLDSAGNPGVGNVWLTLVP